MLELLQYIIATLTSDATLNAIIPANQIFTGPVDVSTELQSELLLPQINVHVISEVSRTVPLNARDTVVQIDIWSRNNQIEVINAAERVITLLNYQSEDKGAAHMFWGRLSGTNDINEMDRRIFHRALSFQYWEMKP